MKMLSWSPFRDVDDVFGRYRRLISEMAGEGEGIDVDWRPVADITETKKEYLIKAELPEVDREDVNVSVEDGRITISGERKMEKEEEDETHHRIESFYGTFSRTFALPDDVDEGKISAESRNGMLKVHLPKTKETKSKKTQITVQ